MKAVKKPIEVDVRGPLLERESVPTAHGYIAAEIGDMVITDPGSGDTWPILQAVFLATYEVTDATLDQRPVYNERPAVTEIKEIKE